MGDTPKKTKAAAPKKTGAGTAKTAPKKTAPKKTTSKAGAGKQSKENSEKPIEEVKEKKGIDYWLEPEGLLRIHGWARDGLINAQIADNMGIATNTLNNWRLKYPEIATVLKESKEVADRHVENALYKKATGFHQTVKKYYKLKDITYQNGQKVREVERIEEIDEVVYYPPDTTAQIFWLKNRKTLEWRDKRDYNLANEGDSSIKIELSGDLKDWAK